MNSHQPVSPSRRPVTNMKAFTRRSDQNQNPNLTAQPVIEQIVGCLAAVVPPESMSAIQEILESLAFPERQPLYVPLTPQSGVDTFLSENETTRPGRSRTHTKRPKFDEKQDDDLELRL